VPDVDGYRASLLQHEIDHLNGVLTLDRAERPERRRAMGIRLDRGRTRLEAAGLPA
jgi:peptide deformylase